MMFNTRNHNRTIYIISLMGIAALALLRLLMFYETPLWAWGDYGHDDALMTQYATSILSGHWLGDYNNRTLIKGISYPLFLVFCKLVNGDYLVILGIYYILAIVVFLISIKSIVKNIYSREIIFVFLLYSPVMFADYTVQRIYRMAIIPPTVLILISCLWGLFLRRHEPPTKIFSWAMGTGLSLSFFWNIREDSIWIAPFVITALVICVICIFIKEKRISRLVVIKVAIIACPLIILNITNGVIKEINYHYYGVAVINERSETYFSKMISDMLKVDSSTEREDVWIPKSAFENMINECPTLEQNKEAIMELFDSGWAVNGELQGDLFIWALREAMQKEGYFCDAKTANEFSKQVYEELELAFEEGRIKFKKALYITSMAEGLQLEEVPDLIVNLIQAIKIITHYDNYQMVLASSTGHIQNIKNMQSIVQGKYFNPMTIRGWAFAYGSRDQLEIEVVDDNDVILGTVNFEKSADVAEVYPDYINAQNARFDIVLPYKGEKNIYFNIYLNGILVNHQNVVSQSSDEYCLFIDQCELGDTEKWDKTRRVVNFSNKIISIYSAIDSIINIITGIIYVFLVWLMGKELEAMNDEQENKVVGERYTKSHLWLVVTGLLLSILVLTVGLSWFNNWKGAVYSNRIYFYGSAGVVLLQVVQAVLIAYVVEFVNKYFLIKRSR